MRATMAVLLCAALLLCGGCGSGAAAPKSETAPEPTAAPTAVPTAAPAAEPEQESGGFAPDFTFSSVASTLLTTESAVATMKEDLPAAPAGAGMPGMM